MIPDASPSNSNSRANAVPIDRSLGHFPGKQLFEQPHILTSIQVDILVFFVSEDGIGAQQGHRPVNPPAGVQGLHRLAVAVDVHFFLGVDETPLVHRVVVVHHQMGLEVRL